MCGSGQSPGAAAEPGPAAAAARRSFPFPDALPPRTLRPLWAHSADRGSPRAAGHRRLAVPIYCPAGTGRGRSSPVSRPRGHPRYAAPRSRALSPPSREEQGLGVARTARPEGRNPSGPLCSCTSNSLPSFLPVSRGSSPSRLLQGARRVFQTFPTAAPERPRPRDSRRGLSPPERPRPGPYLK